MRRLLALGLAAGLVACQRTPAAPKAARHVVIVTIDTLRADRLGCYGARDVATPRLDRIAASGALAVEASAHVPLTRPSHVSIFTGLLPTEHGIRDNVSPAVVPRVPLLAELFRKSGFATGAFVSSVVLESQSGLDRGFDVYADRFEGASGDAQFLNTVQKKGEDTIAEAVAWLRGQAGRRVFLWLHLYEPHDPYEPPEPYASRYAGRPYDGEVAWSDELVGRFEDALASLGLARRHRARRHLRPRRGPGRARREPARLLRLPDDAPRPLPRAGPGNPAGPPPRAHAAARRCLPHRPRAGGPRPAPELALSGRSLAAALRGAPEPEEPTTYAETLVPLLQFGWSDLRVIREGRFKYVQAPRPELYDLREDPGERRDLARERASQAAAMRAALAKVLERERQVRREGSRRALGRGHREAGRPRLRRRRRARRDGDARGGPQGQGRGVPDRQQPDPRGARRLPREGSRDERPEAAPGPGPRRRELRGALLPRAGARRAGSSCRRRSGTSTRPRAACPAHAAAWQEAAECRVRAGDSAGALQRLRSGEAASPGDAGLRRREARLLRELGRREEARRAYEAALPLAPREAQLRAELGELLRDLGEAEAGDPTATGGGGARSGRRLVLELARHDPRRRRARGGGGGRLSARRGGSTTATTATRTTSG